MKTQKSSQIALAAAALAVVVATAALPVLAAEKTNTGVSTVTQSRGGIHPETANIAVNSAHAMINHLRKVEVLLDAGEVAEARNILASSRDFARKLQRMKMKAELAYNYIINSNKTEYAGVSVSAIDRVGIYSSLDEIEVYAPEIAEITRERLKQAEMHTTSGNTQLSAKTLKDVAAEVPSSLLPGYDIDQQILLALEFLEENLPDISMARNEVKKALNGLKAVVETTAAPSD